MLSKTSEGIKTQYKYNAGNQLVSDGVNKYTYDGNGNLVQKGNTKYTYNALNLLESWTDGSATENYTYNAFGLLSSVKTPESTTSFAWDILNGDGQMLSSTVNGVTTDYTYGLERISAQTKGQRTEYVYDARGSVIAEVNSRFLSSDVSTKAYSPFGEPLNDNVSGFGYNGEYYNAATGMIYLRARFYAPEMNRFSQKDILKGSVTDALSLNRYLYCANDPVNFIDPSGMEAIVISGGDYRDLEESEENLNSYNFIIASLHEIDTIQSANADETVTWIVADAGWTEEDHSMFNDAAAKRNVKIEYIKNTNELTDYINSGGGNISRDSEKISYMSVFAHGIVQAIPLAFDYDEVNKTNAENDALTITKATVRNWNKESFAAENPSVSISSVKLYSCKGANGKPESLAETIAKATNSNVYAYQGKSRYADLTSNFIDKAVEVLFNKSNPESDKVWNSLSNKEAVASINPPRAASGAKTVMVSPTGQKTTIKEIPSGQNTPKQTIVSQITTGITKVANVISNGFNSLVNKIKGWFGK